MEALDESLLRQCVHCGLCLDACPTYVELGNEADSPRGRIHLIAALAGGTLEPSRAALRHLDLCLGCRACESACPSGVRYGAILEAARADLAGAPRPLLDRLRRNALLAIFPHPRRLRALAALVRVLQSAGVWSLVEKVIPAARLMPRLAAPTEVGDSVVAGESERVELFTGCVSAVFQPAVNAASVRVINRCGASVVTPSGQRCCGALHLHAGEVEGARDFARANIDAFGERSAAIVVTAAGCGAALREYAELLRDDADYGERARRFAERVVDVTRFVDQHLAPDLATGAGAGVTLGRVTYHDACHLAHAQGVRQEPRNILRRIAGVELVEMSEADRCCGSAGSYNLSEAAMATALARRKVDDIERSGATCVAVANAGCAMQIAAEVRRRGAATRVAHPIELLDEALPPAC